MNIFERNEAWYEPDCGDNAPQCRDCELNEQILDSCRDFTIGIINECYGPIFNKNNFERCLEELSHYLGIDMKKIQNGVDVKPCQCEHLRIRGI